MMNSWCSRQQSRKEKVPGSVGSKMKFEGRFVLFCLAEREKEEVLFYFILRV